ncbi:MAG: OsmC family protein [Caldilineaceae bacterium]|nr:OsmC family protein [Caldilineaceae bacterium]
MSSTMSITMQQISPTTTKAVIRTHEVLVDRTIAKEGTDLGPMGGEILLAAIGGCFMSTLLAAVRGRDAAISDIRTEVVATVDGTPTRVTAVELQVSADYADRDLMEKLLIVAERGCLVANSIRGAIDLSVRLVN